MTNNKRLFFGLFSVFALITLFTLHTFGQSPPLPDGINPVTATNAAPANTPAVSAQTTGIQLLMILIPLAVPLIVGTVKFFTDKIPSVLIPIICPSLALLLNWITSLATGHGVGPVEAAMLGSAGVGVREIFDQLRQKTGGTASALAPMIVGFLLIGFVATGCGHQTLAPGGAYAPGTNVATVDATTGIASTNFVATSAPDLAFFQVESAFDFAYSTIDAVFTIEHDNRLLLWKISPDIKHTIDKLRPEAVTIRNDYIKARIAYQANPVPANLTQLQTILARLQSTAAAVQAAIPANVTAPTTPAK